MPPSILCPRTLSFPSTEAGKLDLHVILVQKLGHPSPWSRWVQAMFYLCIAWCRMKVQFAATGKIRRWVMGFQKQGKGQFEALQGWAEKGTEPLPFHMIPALPWSFFNLCGSNTGIIPCQETSARQTGIEEGTWDEKDSYWDLHCPILFSPYFIGNLHDSHSWKWTSNHKV